MRPMTNAKRGNDETMAEHTTTDHTRPLLKEGEVARILSVEVATLRRWRWSGRGPHFVKLGGAVRYDLADIEAFIEASRRASTSDPGPHTEAA